MVVFAGEGFSVAMREASPEKFAVDVRVRTPAGWVPIVAGRDMSQDRAVKVAAEEVCKRAA